LSIVCFQGQSCRADLAHLSSLDGQNNKEPCFIRLAEKDTFSLGGLSWASWSSATDMAISQKSTIFGTEQTISMRHGVSEAQLG